MGVTASQGERRPLTLTLSRHGVRLRRATRQGRGDFAIVLSGYGLHSSPETRHIRAGLDGVQAHHYNHSHQRGAISGSR